MLRREANEALPITVLTGFLGSGKTTLLQALLRSADGVRLGVVMNEIGQTGIEAPLRAADTRPPAPGDSNLIDYVELGGGCVCCLVNRDLETTLKEMCQRFDLDRVVLETTGLADPQRLLWNLQPEAFGDRIRVDAVVTTLDPTTFRQSESPEWRAQVSVADVLVMTKGDVASPAEIVACEQAARALNTRARLLDGHTEATVSVMLDLPLRGPEQLSLFAPHAEHSHFEVMNLVATQPFALAPLQAFLQTLPATVVRAKGYVLLDTNVWCRFHVVGGRVDVQFSTDAPEHGQSRAVLFGRALERARLERGFFACSAPSLAPLSAPSER